MLTRNPRRMFRGRSSVGCALGKSVGVGVGAGSVVGSVKIRLVSARMPSSTHVSTNTSKSSLVISWSESSAQMSPVAAPLLGLVKHSR